MAQRDRHKIKVKHFEELIPLLAGLVKEGICFECEEGEGGWVIFCTGGF